MPLTKAKKDRQESPAMPSLQELDRVKLTKAVSDKGRALGSGSKGTIVLCHGTEPYEVEFDGIEDFFQISAKDLAKVQ